MSPKDTIEETYAAISANKARSGLTILGIVIGISSVIALVSVGQGASSSISASVQSLGSNLIEITPGAAPTAGGFAVSSGRGTAKTLTQGDADAILGGVSNVEAVASEVSGRYQVTAKGTNTNTTVDGVTSSYPQIRDIIIDQGSFITDTQNQSLAKVAVIGPTVVTRPVRRGRRRERCGRPDNPHQRHGVHRRRRDRHQGTSGFNNQDDMIYVPAMSAQRFLSGNDYLSTIDVEATDANSMTQVQNDVTDLLLTRHNISDPTKADFSVLNQASILASASSIGTTLTYLLGAIAGISLLVGGIGIMNMMLTTVTERTREIGLRKAIGAKKSDISRQFVIEAMALTIIGGVIGIVLGVAISLGVNYLGIISTTISLPAIGLAFGVSAAIGIVFGWYPARRAAGLNPIEALRYE